MIKKRPLCVTVLAAVLLLMLLPSGLWMEKSLPECRKPAEGLTGKICKIEPREDGQAVYLTHSYLSDKGILLIYFDAEQPFSINCRQLYHTNRASLPYLGAGGANQSGTI